MADLPLSGERPLTEPERQAFQRLLLTPGHWAALVAAPFLSRRSARPLLRTKPDLDLLNRLRLQLRTVPGMSDEAGRFWNRATGGLPAAEVELAQRLFAWHLATDLTYPRRVAFYDAFWTALGHFAARAGMAPPEQIAAIMDLYRFVDQYLPVGTFTPHEPPRVDVPVPPPAVLDALGRRVAPGRLSWPLIDLSVVRFQLPVTVSLLGESVRDWWFKPDAPRRAVASGMANLPFEERERFYDELEREWQHVFQGSHGKSKARDCAARFVSAVREWIDGVRAAVRPARAAPAAAPAPESEAAERIGVPVAAAPGSPPPPPPEVDPGAVVFGEPEPVPASRALHPEFVRMSSSVRNPPPPPPPEPEPPPKPERVATRRAEGFEPVGLDAALARARAVSVAEVCAWVDRVCARAPELPLLFDDCYDPAAPEIVVVRTTNPVPNEIWVVGDLHADVLALANILAFAQAQSSPDAPAHFLFLGDFVDRGVHDHETLLLLFRLLMDHPERVCLIPGNHDIDLRFDEAANRFRVTIEPAEYCDALNAALARGAPADLERVALARAFIRFCAGRPKAVFLPDGTLFAHGGFPHTDAQKDLAALGDLCKPRCLDDFLWARIAESARVKRPNRSSRGHEFGWDTLVQFAKVATEKLGLPVKRLVRGHDHVTDRWMEYPEYADNGVAVLTLNAMGRLLDGEPARRDGRAHPFPVVGRYVPNHLPEVVTLPLDPAEVDRAFQRPRPRPADPEAVGAGLDWKRVIGDVLTRQQPAEPPQGPTAQGAVEGPEGGAPAAGAAP
jgi:hypothetical protein